MSTTTTSSSVVQEINTKFGLERHNSVESVNSSNEEESEDEENFELEDHHNLVNLLKQKYNVMSSMPPPQFTNTRYIVCSKITQI